MEIIAKLFQLLSLIYILIKQYLNWCPRFVYEQVGQIGDLCSVACTANIVVDCPLENSVVREGYESYR